MTTSTAARAALSIDFDFAPIANGVCDLPWAVVAFVPEDLAWCDWLFTALNGWRVPAALSYRPTSHRLALPTFLSIHPDPSSPSPFEVFAGDLAGVGHLLVICSVNSSHVRAIDDQIRAFKRAGGEERIIAIVVEGEPEAGPALATAEPADHWLPPWLRWRLGEDGFAAADRTEPLVIDARPRFRTPAQVRTALRAALLDVSPAELEKVSAAPLSPPQNIVAFSPAVESRPTPTATEHAARVPGARPKMLTVAACSAVAVLLGSVWISGTRDTPVEGSAPRLPAKEASRIAPATTGPALSTSPSDLSPTSSEPPPASLPSADRLEPAGATIPAVATDPPPAGPSTAELARRRNEERLSERLDLESRGDSLLEDGHHDTALATYEEALAFALSGGSPDDPATKIGIATLCRKLGALQVGLASSAEARQSFKRGQTILASIKRPGPLAKEHRRLSQDLESSLRTLPRD